MKEFSGTETDKFRVIKYRSPSEKGRIDYRISNNISEPVTLRIIEKLPDGVSPGDFTTDSANMAELSTQRTDESALSFEITIGPNQEVRKRLFVRPTVLARHDFHSTPPAVEHISTRERHLDSVVPVSERSRLESNGVQQTNTRTDNTSESISKDSDDRERENSNRGNTIVGELADELASGSVDEADISRLRRHLVVDSTESQRVKQQYLQSKVSEYAAFFDEFERFLDDAGRPLDVLESIQERFDRHDRRLMDFQREFTALRDQHDELQHQHDEIDAELSRIEVLAETVERLQTDLRNVADWVDTLDVKHENRAHRQKGEIDQLTDWRRRVTTALQSLEDELSPDN